MPTLDQSPPPQHSYVKAGIWMLCAVLSLTFVAVASKAAIRDIDVASLLFYRSVIGLLVVVGGIYIYFRNFDIIKTDKIKTHIIRNIFHMSGQYLWVLSLGFIPIATVFAFEFTSPIWVALIAPFLLGEAFKKIRIFVILLGFIGVLIILRPGFVEMNEGHLYAILCSFGFAASFALTKKLSNFDHPLCILFYMTSLQMVFTFILASFTLEIPSNNISYIYIILVGVLGLSAHFSMAKALTYGDSTFIAAFDYTRLPLAAFAGYLFYQEMLDIWVFIGGLIVLFGNYLNISDMRKSKKAKPSS